MAGVGQSTEGNANVASSVLRTPYSIGYVEYSIALELEMSIATLQNRAGRFVAPTDASVRAAAETADWDHVAHFNLVLADAPGSIAWPITSVTWVVIPRHPVAKATTKATLNFFGWSLQNGGSVASYLGYSPLPETLVTLIRQTWPLEFGR